MLDSHIKYNTFEVFKKGLGGCLEGEAFPWCRVQGSGELGNVALGPRPRSAPRNSKTPPLPVAVKSSCSIQSNQLNHNTKSGFGGAFS
jgi:hypothetical protein